MVCVQVKTKQFIAMALANHGATVVRVTEDADTPFTYAGVLQLVRHVGAVTEDVSDKRSHYFYLHVDMCISSMYF